MEEHWLQFWRCECPPYIQGSSVLTHFQHTCVFHAVRWLNTDCIFHSGNTSPVAQSYRFHRVGNGTVSCLCQTSGRHHSNIPQTVHHTAGI